MARRCEDRSASSTTVHRVLSMQQPLITCIVPGLDGDVVLGPGSQGHLHGERGTNSQQVRASPNCPLNRASACANLVKQDDPRAASQARLGMHSPAAHSCPQLVSVRSPRLLLATAHTL